MQPITKRYQNGDKFPAEDMNQFIEAINAGLTPEIVLSKENVKAIVTKLVYDIVMAIQMGIGGSDEIPPLSLENNILELSNVLDTDTSANIREKLQFKLKMDENFDTITCDELCDMVNEVLSIMGMNVDMEISEGTTVRDFIEDAYDKFIPQLLPAIRNLLGNSLNQAFVMTETIDTNFESLINDAAPGIFEFVLDIFRMASGGEGEDLPNIDFGLLIPTQVFLDKLTTKYNCQTSDIRIFIFNIASLTLLLQLIAPIIKIAFGVIGKIGKLSGGGSSGMDTNTILNYVSTFLGGLSSFVIKDQHLLVNVDLVWPYTRFDYYLSLCGKKEPLSGDTDEEETVITPKREDSGLRLWGDDENNRIGIVRLSGNLLKQYRDYFGDYIDAVNDDDDAPVIPFAGKLTVRDISLDGSEIVSFSGVIDLDDKYYGKHNMQVNKLRINETTEGFQVAFMRNNTTLFSIDSEMR